MAWFHPKTLLDKAFEVGIIFKGVDGALEIVGGILLLAVPSSTIQHLTWLITHHELTEDPGDFLANNAVRLGHQLAVGRIAFALIFLLPHGAVKVALVIALLRQKLWAYPWALGALTVFLIYQMYLVIAHTTIITAALTVLDVVIIWLVWREWQKVRPRPATTE
jgi:uncharacterized membrane protein